MEMSSLFKFRIAIMIPKFLPSKIYMGLCGVDKVTKGSEQKAEVSTLLYFVSLCGVCQ
jgi:hypothetical protein